MNVCLMSIKPKWAKELYSGKKTVEFRKSSPPIGSIVFLYESAPVRAVTGAFIVSAVLSAASSHVWAAVRLLKSVWRPGTVKCVELYEYSGGAMGKCCAILTDYICRFPESEWISPTMFAVKPPQSWQVLSARRDGSYKLALKLLTIAKSIHSKEVPQ